jgi:hypothetical protein
MRAHACVALWRSGLGEKKCDWSESKMCTGVRGHTGAQENCDMLGNLFGDWDGHKRLLGFLTETNAFFKTTPCHILEHPDTSNPPGAR